MAGVYSIGAGRLGWWRATERRSDGATKERRGGRIRRGFALSLCRSVAPSLSTNPYPLAFKISCLSWSTSSQTHFESPRSETSTRLRSFNCLFILVTAVWTVE